MMPDSLAYLEQRQPCQLHEGFGRDTRRPAACAEVIKYEVTRVARQQPVTKLPHRD